MARRSISGLPPQYAKNAGGASASGYWLKLYTVGTTTPKLMYTLDIGGSSLAKCKLNTRGETISNSSDDDSVFVPYVDGPYKAILYATEADADADNTANALWTCDNIDNTSSTGYQTIVAAEFATISTLISGTPINELGSIDWSDYEGREVNVVVNNTTSKSGGAPYIIKTVAQAAADGDVIDGTGAPNYYGANHALTGGTHVAILRANGESSNAMCFGFKNDGSNESAVFTLIADYGFVYFPAGNYKGTFAIVNKSSTTFTFSEGAEIESVGSTQVLQISSSTAINIYGGNFSSELRVSRTVAITGSSNIKLRNVCAYFATKSTYVGAAIYGTAGIFIDTCSLCSVIECETYNIEGFGVATIGTGGRHLVERNYVHDNVGGILNNSNDNNFNRYINNNIGFNDVSPGGSGNDGILVNATDINNSSSGHEISGNRIYSSGEHAMYIQCANTLISNNRCYSNDTCGIKVAKCRNVQITNNVCFDNNSNIQVQSGYENILIEGNSCSLSLGNFDLDFTWNTGLDPFGGRSVKVIGNYFLSNVANWSADMDGTDDIIFENNTCQKGLIYSGNATAPYTNVKIKKNEFLEGTVRVINCSAPEIVGNTMENLYCTDSNTDVILDGNTITALSIGTRKDVQLNAFKSIRGNVIVSPDISGAPNFEIFNGQDATNTNLRFSDNDITTAGAIIINVNTSGGLIDSVVSNNIFNVTGGTAVQIIVTNSGNVFNGNVGMSGTVTSTNSVGIGNTGGAVFSGAGSSYANNI